MILVNVQPTPPHETFAPQPQPIEPQPNKMFLLCLFLEIKVVKGKIRSIYIKGLLLTLINWINITNNIPNMVKKHSVVKLPKQLPFRNFFLCLQKKSS